MDDILAQAISQSPGWGILTVLLVAYIRHEVQTRNGGTREQRELVAIRNQISALREEERNSHAPAAAEARRQTEILQEIARRTEVIEATADKTHERVMGTLPCPYLGRAK